MFGETIDYYLLKPFTHSRNLATEEELDRASSERKFNLAVALGRVDKLRSRLGGVLPMWPGVRYLDVGCGQGDIAIALAKSGVDHVTGVDIMKRNIVTATANAERQGVADRVAFVCEDINRWRPAERFDVVLSHEALEHIEDPRGFLRELARLLAPDGVAILAFGPLFHSPIGDHMDGFFSVQIPWRGALFSERALLRLRQERYRPTDPATSLRDIQGKLNMMRFSEFLEYVGDGGWEVEYLAVNPQLQRLPPAKWLSDALLRLPWVRDYVASSVYAVLRKAGGNAQGGGSPRSLER